MRVLIVTRPWSFHGGIETATAGILRGLVDYGDDVHVLTPGTPPPVPGVTIHSLRVPPLPSSGRAVAFALLARRQAQRGRWDVVQTHERTLGADVYRAGEGCHRAYLEHRDDRGGRAMYHRVVLALERRVFAETPAIVAIARRGRAEIQRLYGVADERVAVVYNGVDLERFHPANRARHRDRARGEAGVPAAARVLLFVGSGFARKGLATVIDALGALDDPSARLLVVGKGDPAEYRALAERRGIADRVVWLGPRPDVERWYAAADGVVLPARYEPFGNVHLEALASGVPMLTSARAGGAEVIVDGVNGAVREPRDAAGFADAFRTLVAVPEAERIARARASAEPYTYARQVAELRAVWARKNRAKGDFP
ncbi:MAG: glycosyltransferase family 4 protein [Candidatus Rokubacteria bacterium]|nr:glycosyltransferase family 4 protein [Candidatus Rokubacteria bacterium]